MAVHVLLIYGGGRVEDGLLLGTPGARMRVMLRGRADAVEFQQVDGVWMNESGASVQIGAAMPVGSIAEIMGEMPRLPRPCPELYFDGRTSRAN